MLNNLAAPEWARENRPDWIKPYVGRDAMPDRTTREDVLAAGCEGIDFYHGNNWILHCRETSDYLYSEYTPLDFKYREGSHPEVEKLARELTRGAKSHGEMACRIADQLSWILKHPGVPPLCGDLRADRNLGEDELIRSGKAYCNEQARVFVRMAQSLHIPARLAFLFYADGTTSHAIAEACVDGNWAMVDLSYASVFPGRDGRLMSVRDVHLNTENRMLAGMVLENRAEYLASLPQERVFGGRCEGITDEAERIRVMKKALAKIEADFFAKDATRFANDFNYFGLLNYPLPPELDGPCARDTSRRPEYSIPVTKLNAGN